MSARSRAASWAQKRAIANPFQAEIPTSPPNDLRRFADPLHHGLVAGHDQRGADGDAAFGDGRLRSFAPISPSSRMVSANTSLPPRRSRQRSMNSPCSIRSPIAARPNTTISHSKSEASSARSISMRREIRARSNRMVSCGSQARCAPASALSAMLSCGCRPGGAIDLLGRRRRQRQPRALAGCDIDVETVAAGDAAGGVDEHAGQAVAFG